MALSIKMDVKLNKTVCSFCCYQTFSVLTKEFILFGDDFLISLDLHEFEPDSAASITITPWKKDKAIPVQRRSGYFCFLTDVIHEKGVNTELPGAVRQRPPVLKPVTYNFTGSRQKKI